MTRIYPGLLRCPVAISMTLCELEIAHLSPPMECRSVRQNAAATPAGRRHCVEWVLFLLLSSLMILTNSNFRALARSAQSWSSYSGYFRESSKPGSTRTTALLMTPLARMCYAYQHLNDIGTSDTTSTRGTEMNEHSRYRKKYLPKYHCRKTASGSVLTQAGTELRKKRSTAVSIHHGKILPWTLPTPLISPAGAPSRCVKF